MNETATTTATKAVEDGHGYDRLEFLIRERVADAKGPLFQTDCAERLFGIYLNHIHPAHRQYYHCRTCEHFITEYGSLITVLDSGLVQPLLWGATMLPDFFKLAIAALYVEVNRARITGVFVSEARIWGRPENTSKTGVQWTHLHGTPNKSLVWNSPLKTANQRAAELREEYVMLKKAIAEFSMEAAVQAVRVLEADALSRGEKTLGVAQWFLNLHIEIKDKASRQRDNLLWRATALAPAGWCHVRSSMIGTLLQDVVDGLPYESIARRWAEKMHPLQYRRPTAPPKEGNIKQAEELIAKLGTAGALDRRWAKLEDIQNPLWLPRPLTAEKLKQAEGVFDHLKANVTKVKELELPPRMLTWEKFQTEVLPDALTMEINVPNGSLPFCGLLTAVNPDAPPLLQWDLLATQAARMQGGMPLPRNPVSWYFYHGGSPASAWGLEPGWVEVAAVAACPAHWQLPQLFTHVGEMALFVLKDCRDKGSPGLGLFPECLRAEYHGVRSVLEAHSRSRQPSGREEASANGLALQKGGVWQPLMVRVRTDIGVSYFKIDRWE